MLRAMPPILLLAVLPVAAAPADRPVRLTTDSSAYCVELSARFARQPGAGTEPARGLAEQGRKLCEVGHVRTGIARLRRALRAVEVGG